MAVVPNNESFSLQDVIAAVTGAGNDLQSCFTYANALRWDPAYNSDAYAPANSMKRFRNYGALHYLGESFGGGYVIYVDGSNHGLICSAANLTDSGNTLIRWFNGANRASISTSTSIGTGLSNTNNIISVIGSSGIAANVCKNYSGGGYTDWYMPAKDEAEQIIYCFRSGYISGFASNDYLWSSSQYDAVYAWLGNVNNSVWTNEDDFNMFHVRAVRSF